MKRSRVVLGWIALSGLSLAGQCSDTGVCGLERPPSTGSGHWGLTLLEGKSGEPDRLRVQTLRLEGGLRLGDSRQLLVSLPLVRVSGPLGATSGVGDLSAILDQTLWKGEGATLSGQVGARVGTGKADGAPDLPQSYQTGLGGTDFLAGLRLVVGSWTGGVGYQGASGRSTNPITRLQRGDDLLGWVEYGASLGPGRLTLKANVIKRLQVSNIRDAGSGSFRDLPESDFTQANGAVAYAWRLGKTWNVEAGLSLPFLKRRTNEDGSKRALTLNLGVKQRF